MVFLDLNYQDLATRDILSECLAGTLNGWGELEVKPRMAGRQLQTWGTRELQDFKN